MCVCVCANDKSKAPLGPKTPSRPQGGNAVALPKFLAEVFAVGVLCRRCVRAPLIKSAVRAKKRLAAPYGGNAEALPKISI